MTSHKKKVRSHTPCLSRRRRAKIIKAKGPRKREVKPQRKQKQDRTHLGLSGDTGEKNDDDEDDYMFKHKRNDPLVT